MTLQVTNSHSAFTPRFSLRTSLACLRFAFDKLKPLEIQTVCTSFPLEHQIQQILFIFVVTVGEYSLECFLAVLVPAESDPETSLRSLNKTIPDGLQRMFEAPLFGLVTNAFFASTTMKSKTVLVKGRGGQESMIHTISHLRAIELFGDAVKKIV